MKKKTVNNKHTSRPSQAPSAVPSGKKPSSDVPGFFSKAAPVISVGGFVIFSFVLLLCCYADYMHKIESLSIFVPVSSFFDNCMSLPGGLLTWAGSFCTLSMHIPALGGAVYSLLLLAVILATVKAFSIPRGWTPLAIIPAALILLSFVSFGYLIYTVKPLGYAFSLPLGVLSTLLLFYGVGILRHWWLRSLAIVLIVIVGYPFLGFYALLAALLCSIDSLRANSSASRVVRWIPAICGVLAIVLVPRIWFVCMPGDLMESQIYISGLPRFFARETWMRCLYGSVFLSLFICATYRILPGYLRWNKTPHWLWAAVCVGAVALVSLCRYSDRNFMLGLRLDRCIWDKDYARAVEAAKNADFTLTRANTMLAYIAMIRTGEMGMSMFAIPYGNEPYNTTRDARSIFDVCGALASYHLGMPNYAYRWGMEYTLEQGLTVERLKLMAKSALLNREPALARTYLDILYNVPTHRSWAKKYLGYLENPYDMMADPEIRDILPLMCHENEFINDQGSLEGYVWNLLANAPAGSPQFDELCMQASLIVMDLDAFMRRLPDYAVTHRQVPIVYQQAALLWSLLGKQPCPIEIDPSVRAAHEEFLGAFRRVSGMSDEEQRKQMSQFFHNTYWYYFIFMSDQRL